MSDAIPAASRPLPVKKPAAEELTALNISGALLLIAGVITIVVAQTIGSGFLSEFDIEDLAQKITATVIGAGLAVAGAIALIASLLLSGIRSTVLSR
ncbi:hypothetical protein [Microbacterium sp. CFBP9034]|uniref:hypothetical protein n=1 Tax=Microbacterium sp. CFBP9034 TaxID=3096540 RepID=UPI002A6B5B0C|nr:hypothetical protein [Microbacterium sp. CFBP9034]MDY0909589.1 hypothetical protein [Microbacterium sp. CFBP9034]